jgi:hypothetical protein
MKRLHSPEFSVWRRSVRSDTSACPSLDHQLWYLPLPCPPPLLLSPLPSLLLLPCLPLPLPQAPLLPHLPLLSPLSPWFLPRSTTSSPPSLLLSPHLSLPSPPTLLLLWLPLIMPFLLFPLFQLPCASCTHCHLYRALRLRSCYLTCLFRCRRPCRYYPLCLH